MRTGRITMSVEDRRRLSKFMAKYGGKKENPMAKKGTKTRANSETWAEKVKKAESIVREDYYRDVRDVAESVVEFAKGKLADDGEYRSDDIQEEMSTIIDGHERVIYTGQAMLGLAASDNEDAYMDAFGEVPMQGGNINWSALMYAAMEQDVNEYLSRNDFKWDDVADDEE